jgi:hypothetical protein
MCAARLWTDHHHIPDLPEEEPVPDPDPTLFPVFDDGQAARTAGEQDHTDPWVYAGEDADPPEAL